MANLHSYAVTGPNSKNTPGVEIVNVVMHSPLTARIEASLACHRQCVVA
jgi:hypothetical protein